ncbi:KGK domain-containing protein [Oxynema sp. CENA135]|jgi:hypothetical protein|uniref:KGK domain-containing protein n=1 Tax=Oxynema aestuarii AP17 TaxID=2064643 RepID=A0A6H1TWX2_9CYAN|nr:MULTISPECIES: KGK domain-containing protein [Oxynema]MBK4729272.1 KGK domain-containing protein [Oxynema sp. CENA135]QIZ70925.1 KGK domain-containing protein [Oxynema aestuarii AP17]RMH77862.1 MAG: KGK domain-containing protein [Cyanobacteria bacterium J007]
MQNGFESLGYDDVISTSASNLMFQCTFKVSEFMALLQTKLEEENLFSEGLDCEVLSPGQKWRRGKVMLRLEFYPEGTEMTTTQPSEMPEYSPSDTE